MIYHDLLTIFCRCCYKVAIKSLIFLFISLIAVYSNTYAAQITNPASLKSNSQFLTAMKYMIELDDQVRERIEKFRAGISKQAPVYDKIRCMVRKQFAEVIKEEISKCVSCGMEFVGKSIGPHYKNSPACAAYKKEKKREEMNEEPKEPREPREPRRPLTTVEPNIQKSEPIPSQVKQQAIFQSEPIYDEVNEYFV